MCFMGQVESMEKGASETTVFRIFLQNNVPPIMNTEYEIGLNQTVYVRNVCYIITRCFVGSVDSFTDARKDK